MSEYPALEIGADLSLDEPCDGRTLPPRPSQEGFELFANDLVKKGRLGLVAFVSDGGKQPIGTMRARLLPAIASDVPRSREQDASDPAGRPRAQARRCSVVSSDVRIEPTGSRVPWNRADSSLRADRWAGRTRETFDCQTRPTISLDCYAPEDETRSGVDSTGPVTRVAASGCRQGRPFHNI